MAYYIGGVDEGIYLSADCNESTFYEVDQAVEEKWKTVAGFFYQSTHSSDGRLAVYRTLAWDGLGLSGLGTVLVCDDDPCKRDGAVVRKNHSAYENQHRKKVLSALAKDKDLPDFWNWPDIYGDRKLVWMPAFMEAVFFRTSDLGVV